MKASNVLALLTTTLQVTMIAELLIFGTVAGLFYGMMSEYAFTVLYSYAMLFVPIFMFVAAILIYLDDKKAREWKDKARTS